MTGLGDRCRYAAYGMSFTNFDNALAGYCDFLSSEGKPATTKWLSCSESRFARLNLYVFRPSQLDNSTAARQRFDEALELGKNVAFCWYGSHGDSSLIALETAGLDPPNDRHNESGSLNYKIMTTPVQVVPVNSHAYWQYVKLKSIVSPSGNLPRGWIP